MKTTSPARLAAALTATLGLAAIVASQPGAPGRGDGGPRFRKTEILERFDADKSGILDRAERDLARAWLAENQDRRRGGFGRGPGPAEPERPEGPVGAPILPSEAEAYADQPLYDPMAVRTFFLYFKDADWFDELTAFYRTDIEVPATLVLDGKSYRNVGVRFRGNSSFFGARGVKKSIHIAMDLADKKQRLQGYKTLNLLNAHSDPSFLREVVYSQICREYLPAAKANFAQVVINGESFGVYVNVQQLNNDFIDEWFGTRKGARFKIPPDFSGGGALRYLGDDPARYERSYERKSGSKQDTERLIAICRALSETADSELPAVLPQYIDIDRALWFLALDCVFLDGDGYHSRGSDYSVYIDKKGRLHPLPYDNNEVLGSGRGGPGGRGGPPPGFGAPGGRGGPPGGDLRGPPQGRGRGRGPGSVSPTLSPLALAEDRERPLASRLLAVPEWRARYLHHVKLLADTWLDWNRIGALYRRYHDLIDGAVAADTKSLYGYEAFAKGVESTDGSDGGGSLRAVVERRHRFLAEHETLKGPWPSIGAVDASEAGGPNGGRSLKVTATVGGEATVDTVLLYWSDTRLGAYRVLAMADDGRSGDGAAGDGVYGTTTAAFPAGTKLRYYVEARASAAGRTAFAPAKAEAAPRIHEFD